MKNSLSPAGITLRYAIFAALWIVLSGLVVSLSFEDARTQQLVELVKGMAFVAVTSVLLYFWMSRLFGDIQRTQVRLEATLDALPDLIFELDESGVFLDFHSPSSKLLLLPPPAFLGKRMEDVVPPDVAAIGREALREAETDGHSQGKQYALPLADGLHWFELSVARKPDLESGKTHFIVLARDITDRKRAEAQMERMRKLYIALSECNQSIVRCQSEAELFPIVCRTAVEFGGMKMAWIGMERDGLIKPVAAYGAGIEYLDGIEISTDAAVASGRGPSGTAFRENRPYWCQDFQHDAATAAWHERGAQHGWGASASLPLTRNDTVVGVFNLYAAEAHAFDEVVRNLLQEMAMDISHALGRFADERERQAISARLQESEERYRTAFRTSTDSINITRLSDGRYLDVNEGFERLTGWTRDEVIGKTSTEIGIWHDPEDRQRLVEQLRQNGRCINLEADFNKKNGEVIHGLMSAELIQLQGEPCILTITRDIGAIKQSRDIITLQARRAETLLDLSHALSAAPNLAEVMQLAVSQVQALTRLQTAAIYLLEGEYLHLMATVPPLPEGMPDTLRHALLRDHPHIVTALDQRAPLVLEDMALAPLSPAEREAMTQRNLRTLLYLPLLVENGVLGVLIAGSQYQPVNIDVDDHALYQTFANLVALATQNARSLQQRDDTIAQLESTQATLRRLAQAVEQSPNTIVITDLDANIVYVNQTFTKVTGYSRQEVVGRNPRILKSGKTPKRTYEDLWTHLTAGQEWRGELINKRKDGTEYIESALIAPICDPQGKIINYLAIKEDITEKRLNEERIHQLAHFDQLTGLPNRVLLTDRFGYVLNLARRNGETVAVMFLDLDHFKNINDTLGHTIGDHYLMEIGRRLKAAIRQEDTVSRLGGDEFILLFPSTDADGAARVARKLIEVVGQPFQFEQHELNSTPSIGIALYPQDGNSMEELMKNADAAMYRVKQSGRNGYGFFTAEMQSHSERNLMLLNAMRHALARDEFYLQYQPQVHLADGKVTGAEALLRWRHPQLGEISPTEFIPLAESGGMIVAIGEWVLHTAARQLRQWQQQGMPQLTVAVNLSAVQFRRHDFPDRVSRILQQTGLSPQSLELELTEAVAMDDPQAAVAMMDKLHALGVRMSIDDFGTGYSSLSYLKRFKVYKLKIDQSFVRDIGSDPEDKAIVTAIINLASSLNLHTIAEGVETAEQLAFLRLQGCEEVQGYYFSKPLEAAAFEAFLHKRGV